MTRELQYTTTDNPVDFGIEIHFNYKLTDVATLEEVYYGH